MPEPAAVDAPAPRARRRSELRSIMERTLPSTDCDPISPTSLSYLAAAMSRESLRVVANNSGRARPPFPWPKLLAKVISDSACLSSAVSSGEYCGESSWSPIDPLSVGAAPDTMNFGSCFVNGTIAISRSWATHRSNTVTTRSVSDSIKEDIRQSCLFVLVWRSLVAIR